MSSLPFVLNTSMSSRSMRKYELLANECPAKNMHELLYGSAPRGPGAAHFALGTGVHAFNAYYYESMRRGLVDDATDIAAEALREYMEEHTPRDDERMSSVRLALSSYANSFQDMFHDALVLAVEQEFEIPAGLPKGENPTTRADLVLATSDDRVIVVDHKTTSAVERSRAGYWAQYTALREAVAKYIGQPPEYLTVMENLIVFSSSYYIYTSPSVFVIEPWMARARAAHLDHSAKLYTFYKGLGNDVPVRHNGPETPYCFGCSRFSSCHSEEPAL